MLKKNQESLHIVWMHSHFLYWMGGTKFIYEVIKRLKEKFEITVVVEHASALAKENYEKIGVPLYSMDTLTSTSAMYWLSLPRQLNQDVAFVKKIVQDLQLQGKKVVVVSNMFPMNVVAARLKVAHVQYIFEPFAFFYDPDFIGKFSFAKRSFIQLLKVLYARMDIRATQAAEVVLTLNNTTARYIKEIFGQDSVVTYAGIDTTHFKPFVSNEIKKKYAGKDILIHSTDYTPVKGTDRMIRIFAEVKKHQPKAHLLITSTINNQATEQELKQLAKDLKVDQYIEFLGFVDYDVLPQLYSLAKVLVQCSFSERSGTTSMALPVKEAMACGTLAIRYPIEGEDVEDGVTGYLVDPRNEHKMVETIIKAVNLSDKERKLAGEKSRKVVVEKFTWESTAEIIAETIKSVG